MLPTVPGCTLASCCMRDQQSSQDSLAVSLPYCAHLDGWPNGRSLSAHPTHPLTHPTPRPHVVQAAAGSLATLELNNVAINFSTSALIAAPAATPSNVSTPAGSGEASYAVDLNATLSGGYALVTATLVSPNPVRVELAGLRAANTTQVCGRSWEGAAAAAVPAVQTYRARLQLAVHVRIAAPALPTPPIHTYTHTPPLLLHTSPHLRSFHPSKTAGLASRLAASTSASPTRLRSTAAPSSPR